MWTTDFVVFIDNVNEMCPLCPDQTQNYCIGRHISSVVKRCPLLVYYLNESGFRMIFMSVRSICRISIITGIYTLNVDRYGVRGAPSNELNYHTKRKFHFVEQLVQKERCAVHFMVVHIIICHPVRNNITHIFQYLCIQSTHTDKFQIWFESKLSDYGSITKCQWTPQMRSYVEYNPNKSSTMFVASQQNIVLP